MATPSPSIPIPAAASPVAPLRPPQFPQIPAAPTVKSETPLAEAREPVPVPVPVPVSVPIPVPVPVPVPVAASPSPEPSLPVSYTITIPSCSAWFSWDEIHDTERRILPEFFDGKSASRNTGTYKYYRDSIIRRFRANPSRKLTFTEARRELVGDVGSIRRVFDFLEAWGLINYAPLVKPFLKEKRDAEEGLERKELPRLCSNRKAECSVACFATDKADIILCTRCFVRGNYRPGLSSTDFKRVDISEETKTEWTDKETLHLLEAVLQYGEDWKKVAEHVGSRSEKDCVARFIKLPFGEQFLGPQEDREDCRQYQRNDQVSAEHGGKNDEEPRLSKRRHLTPLADASNPIMAQVAFLSSMVGSEVAEAASQAAIAALHDVDLASICGANSPGNERKEGEVFTANGQNDAEVLEEVIADAQSQLEKEQQDVEQSISDIVEVEMKEIQEKIIHFEEVELQLEKERLQLRYMKDLLFADQLNILQHQARLKPSEGVEGDKI